MRPALLAAAAAAALAAVPAAARAAPPATLSVTGSGQVFVTPDVAVVDLTVEHTASTAEAARGDVARRTSAVLSAVLGTGVRRSAVQTSNLSLSRRETRREGVRYHASETLTVRLTDTKLVSAVIDTGTKAGADDFSGPSFQFSHPSAGLKRAERRALRDARGRAGSAARALGMRVTGVKSVSLEPDSGGVFPGAGAEVQGTAGKGAPTPVEPGRQEVDATVAVVFRIR